MLILDIPSRYVTIGTYANSMMMSLVATCTSVYAGSPFVSSLHTNTIAVHGAVPSSTAPMRYCVDSSGVIIPWYSIVKNSNDMRYMLNGCSNQFTHHVSSIPRMLSFTFFIDLKSIFSIIG